MQMIEVSKLKPHPRNNEFFDDITGDKWKDFVQSIVRRGVVETVVVTQDLMIVSGHQRVKACKEIGILEVPCRITHYPEYNDTLDISQEDMILEDLISTNILQRGIGNANPMKMTRCIIELERIYGIRQGSANEKGDNKIGDQNNLGDQKTQKDLAKQLNITDEQLRNYKKLTTLIPELQTMVEHNDLKATTAYKIYAKLSPEEQEELLEKIGIEKLKKLTQKQAVEEVDKLKEEKEKLEEENENIKQLLEKEKNKPLQTIQVDNTDYTKIEKLNKLLENKDKEFEYLEEEKKIVEKELEIYKKDSEEYCNLKTKMQQLTREKDDISRQIKSATMLVGLVEEVETFIKEKLAPIQYSRAILEMKDDKIVMENIDDILLLVEMWCQEMRKIMPNKNNIINVSEVIR